MWTSRLFWKVFLVYAGLNLTLAVGFLIAAAGWQRDLAIDQVRHRLLDTAFAVRSQVREMLDGDPERLQTLLQKLSEKTQTRLTIVADDGRVIADSDKDPLLMENHSNRKELRDALKRTDGIGGSERESPTLRIPMAYQAVRIGSQDDPLGTVRVAMPITAINAEVAMVGRLLWMYACMVGVVALALTYLVVGQILQPLGRLTQGAQAVASGQLDYAVPVEGRDEFGKLGIAFRSMQAELASRIAQLQDYGDRLAIVLGSMVEGVIAVDGQRRVMLANEASAKMLPMLASEVTGRPLREAVRTAQLAEAVETAFERLELQQIEFELPGDPTRTLFLRATPLPGDKCPGVVVVIHDVTELRRLENLRRELVANVSHELKTPLSSIKAYAETLRLGAINDPANNVGFVLRIEEQADRLHQLIRDMLSLARVEQGAQAFEVGDVQVADAVDACIEQRREAVAADKITLRADPPEQPITVRADEEGFRTILNNLVDNAIMYTPGGGDITIRWRAEDADAVIEVQDTGIGIATEHHARVFERFYRVDKARSRELGGTGLGLSIIKHLSLAFGGEVSLASELGKGSTFQVKLPRG